MKTLVVIALLLSIAALGMSLGGFPPPPTVVVNQIIPPEVKVEPDVSVVAMPAALDKEMVRELLKELKIEVEVAAPNVTVAAPEQPAPVVNVAAPNCPADLQNQPKIYKSYTPARHSRWCPR